MTMLSMVGVFLAAESVVAQQGERLYDWSGGWGRSAPAVSVPATPYLPPINYVPPNAAPSTSAAFYPSTEVAPARNAAVEINMAVPANAKIFFGTTGTTQSGAYRTGFV